MGDDRVPHTPTHVGVVIGVCGLGSLQVVPALADHAPVTLSPCRCTPALFHPGWVQDLDDAYVVEGELGRGGAARVLAARERATGRPVAIKELLSDEPAGFAALAREARLVASLVHPGIVRVLDAGVWIDGTPFLIMPRLAGRTLFAAMASARTARARRGLVAVVIAACDAVAHAHARGVVHRDLTPANIFVGDDGRVTVLDWGLAAEAGAAGDAAGTLAYMAPEQLRGDAVDARADVHALGVILGELCGDDAGAPRALRRLAMRAAAFDPRQRPRDAGELRGHLTSVRSSTTTRATSNGMSCFTPSMRKTRRGASTEMIWPKSQSPLRALISPGGSAGVRSS
jgi:serine/threonine protein kinase